MLMNNSTIGAIIASLRYEKHFSRKKLCQGLCSTQMLIKIENEDANVDKFMLDMLLQRLGKSPSKLEMILSDEEYEKIYARDFIEELIWKKEKRQAYCCLEEYEWRYAKDSNVQKMFVLRMKAYIHRQIEHDINKTEYYIRKAIELTLPGITNSSMGNYLLAEIEMENLLELALCLIERKKEEEGRKILKFCQEYADKNITDEVEYAKINSKITWLISRTLIDSGKYMQAYQMCEKAMEGLRKHDIIYFMIPLFEQLVTCSDKLNVSGNKWKIYYNVIRKIYCDYGREWYCHDSLLHNCVQTNYYLASEFIRQERQAQEMTQEQLIEGVYAEPENLSRMENGKVMPTRKKFEGLLGKLGFERGKYCGAVIVENYEILELKYEIDILIGTGKYKEAEECLECMKKSLDCNKKINGMAVQIYQIIIDSECGKIGLQETCGKLNKVLEDSALLKNGKIYRVPFFNELLALNMLCRILRKMNRLQDSVMIYNAIIDVAEKSKIDSKYQNNILSLVLANANLFDTDKERCNKGIAYELACGKGKMIYMHFLAQIDWIENGNTSREVARLAYYMCDLFYRENNRSRIKEFYEQTYGEKLW